MRREKITHGFDNPWIMWYTINMQTFLPFSNFVLSAQVLDKVRLNKQITECYQILKGSWAHHPATKMWKGYEGSLFEYAEACYLEFVKRGGTPTHKSWYKITNEFDCQDPWWEPKWLGGKIHSNHRARLLHKGNLDVIRKRIKALNEDPNEWIHRIHEKAKITTLSVPDAKLANKLLDYLGAPLFNNWYEQFEWPEKPTDINYWPRVTCLQK